MKISDSCPSSKSVDSKIAKEITKTESKNLFRFHIYYLVEFSIKINNKLNHIDYSNGHVFNADSEVGKQIRKKAMSGHADFLSNGKQ